jgi:hypothetical protein
VPAAAPSVSSAFISQSTWRCSNDIRSALSPPEWRRRAYRTAFSAYS